MIDRADGTDTHRSTAGRHAFGTRQARVGERFTTVSAPRADDVPRVLRSPSAELSLLPITIRNSYEMVKVYKLIAGPCLGPAETQMSLKAGSVSKLLLGLNYFRSISITRNTIKQATRPQALNIVKQNTV